MIGKICMLLAHCFVETHTLISREFSVFCLCVAITCYKTDLAYVEP